MSHLKLLGGAAIAADRGSAIAARRHPIGLLALLATAPANTLARARLVGLLWPDVTEKTARNRLTSCLYEVRTALGDGVLVSVGDEVRFEPAALACDVCLFEEAFAGEHHAKAVALYGGPFLDGFTIPASAAFEQHVDVIRDRLHEKWCRSLESLARDAAEAGDAAAAIRWWRERLRATPWDSRVVRSLMETLASAGNPAEALRAAAEHERLVQGEFGTEPAAEVRAMVGRLRAGRLVDRPSAIDLEAYRIHAQGRGLLDQRTPQEMARAIDYFRRAIDRDPGYALAWSGLADAVSLLEFYGRPVPASAPTALSAARRAVELDPELGPAHASLGIAHSIRREGAAAARELELAVALAPDYAEGHAWLGWVRLLRGDPAGALGPGRRSVTLDPLAPAYRAYLAESLLAAGRPDEALREAAGARESRSAYALPHFVEGLILYHLGRREEAAAAAERALLRAAPGGSPTHAEIRALLAVLHVEAGNREVVDALLGEIRRSAHAFSEGLVLAAIGESEAAFEAFARAEWNWFSVEHARYFFPAVLGPLRPDPRFAAMLEKIDRLWEVGRETTRRTGTRGP